MKLRLTNLICIVGKSSAFQGEQACFRKYQIGTASTKEGVWRNLSVLSGSQELLKGLVRSMAALFRMFPIDCL